jgi:CRP/FNR family cyclic AMP-dependent transcriptional regulator
MIQSNQIRELTAVIRRAGWLSKQPGDFQDWILASATWRHVPPGGICYMEGDESDGLYGLAAGALDISVPISGAEPVSITRAQPGFWIGESAILAGTRRALSLCAIQRSTIAFVPRNKLVAGLRQRPGWWQHFYELSHANATLSINLLAEALALSPRARIARLFLRVADEAGVITGRKEDLGRLIGLPRSSFNRELNYFLAGGIIESGYTSITILRRDELEELRDDPP